MIGLRIERGSSPGASWEIATRPPPPELSRFVSTITGYDERTVTPLARHELPGPKVTVIFELGRDLRVDGVRHGGFVAGLDRKATLTEHDGCQSGFQIDLTPTAARRLFRVDLDELAFRVVPLADILPRE